MHTADRHLDFHRLARSSPGYRWWKPFLTALLGVAFYVIFLIVVLGIGITAAVLSPTGPQPYFDALLELDLTNPVAFALTLVSLILLIPALALATLIMGPRPIGLLSSVTGRIRWRWLGVCTGIALAVYLASIAITVLIDLLLSGDAAASPAPEQQGPPFLLIMLALSLLVVPFQAAAEEYVFRGFLMQAIGGWLKHPAFAILLPVPLFVVGHTYDPLGQADVALFAIFAGWITWRTGGLEAAIAAHAVNNSTIFALGAFGLVDVNSGEGSVGGLVVSVVTLLVFTAVVLRFADRRGVERTRVVIPQPVRYSPYGRPAPILGGMAPGHPGAWPGSSGPSAPSGQPGTTMQDPPAQQPPVQQAPDSRQVSAQPFPARPRMEDTARPAGVPAAPARTSEQTGPVPPPAPTPRTSPGRGTGNESFPPGPAHPAGPAFPSGPGFPAGPGYPPAPEPAGHPATTGGSGTEGTAGGSGTEGTAGGTVARDTEEDVPENADRRA